MTPIERACIAVIDKLREQGDLMADCGDPEWAQVDGAFRVEPLVRAVLASMRSIDLETQDDVEINMLVEGRAVLPEHDEPLQEDALNCWRAMIDAAMQEL
jgi:hypothetical protein